MNRSKKTSRRKVKRNLLTPKINRLVTKHKQAIYQYVEERARETAKEIGSLINKAKIDEGGIIFVQGPIYSGKTLVGCFLNRYVNKTRRFIRGQPRANRPDTPEGKFDSQSGLKCSAVSFSTIQEMEKLFDKNDVILVDNVMFIAYELQSFFLKELTDFVERGGWFVGMGYQYSSQNTEFMLCTLLRQRATRIFNLTSTCQKCGRRGAIYNQRLVRGKPSLASDPELMAPSGDVVYESRCKDCEVVFH